MEGNTVATGITVEAIGKTPPPPNTIVFNSIENGVEMLKISRDGFYVRGEKVPQDDEEVKVVYDAFTSWLRTTGYNI